MPAYSFSFHESISRSYQDPFVNSLVPRRCVFWFKSITFITKNSSLVSHFKIDHRWMPDEKSTLVQVMAIGIDTNIEVIVVSLTTWEAHHSPRAKPEDCGELSRSLMRQQWPKLRYQFLFCHDETKLMMNKQILSIWMLKFVPKLSLVTAWLHVHILGSCDLIVSPW